MNYIQYLCPVCYQAGIPPLHNWAQKQLFLLVPLINFHLYDSQPWVLWSIAWPKLIRDRQKQQRLVRKDVPALEVWGLLYNYHLISEVKRKQRPLQIWVWDGKQLWTFFAVVGLEALLLLLLSTRLTASVLVYCMSVSPAAGTTSGRHQKEIQLRKLRDNTFKQRPSGKCEFCCCCCNIVLLTKECILESSMWFCGVITK